MAQAPKKPAKKVEKTITTQIVEHADVRIFGESCNVCLAHGLQMIGYGIVPVMGGTLRSAIFSGLLDAKTAQSLQNAFQKG